jgi:hypothetical protein
VMDAYMAMHNRLQFFECLRHASFCCKCHVSYTREIRVIMCS